MRSGSGACHKAGENKDRRAQANNRAVSKRIYLAPRASPGGLGATYPQVALAPSATTTAAAGF